MAINMDYCKFENTALAIQECFEELEEKSFEEIHKDLSSNRERSGFRDFLELIKSISTEYEIEIDEFLSSH